MKNRNLGRILSISSAVLGTAFFATAIVAKKKKGSSVYEDAPEERNPLEGKKVVFVENETEPENADGVRGHLESVGDREHVPSVYERYIKRGLDVVLSFGGLVILSPVLAGIALAIKIEDPGPVLFTQKRIGKNKQYFRLHKFRSMRLDTPRDVPTHQLNNPDQYITKVGKFIRSHSLDELPQIWDIFIGNMSVIGPRPGLWNQDFLTAEREKYGANDIKPGLTGWAQINGRDELDIEEKARLDGEYVQKMSFGMDLKVFLGSVHVFGKDETAIEGGTGELKRTIEEKIIPDGVKVSVVVATYKRENALRNALYSLTKQTYKNFEVILVDDNDNSEWTSKVSAIVNEVSTEIDIKHIVNEHNLGSAASRNAGIAAAKGQYITFLDDDDVYLPEKIEEQLKNMISSDADYGITDLYLYNENDVLIDKRIRSYIKSLEENELMKYHLREHMTGTDTFMFKTEYLRKIGGFPGIDIGDEFYLMKEAILGGGQFCYAPHCYVKAFVHSGENEGLSSGERKINGENALHDEKKRYYVYLSRKDIRYVEMRHYAVLAFAEMRRKNISGLVKNVIHAVSISPCGAVKMILKHR